MSERAPSRLCARYGVDTGGFLPATIAMTHATNKFRHVMRPQAPAQGSPPQGALHRVFLRDPQAFHKCHDALLPRSPEPCHSFLRCRTFLGLEICRSFFPRCAWRAGESFDWTRGTTPTHTPPTLGLIWLSSVSLSDWVANGSSQCSRCPTPPPPRPPSSPPSSSPPSYPSPLRVLSHRGGCLCTAHCILYLASLGFGGQGLQLFNER